MQPNTEPLAHNFFDTIYHLRNEGAILLFSKLMELTSEEETMVKDLLETEYDNESIGYPYTPPAYDSDAALWGAKTVYFAAQLLLYRQQPASELVEIIPAYSGEITAAAMLSADLCMRFLPDIIWQLKNIDGEDALIILLEECLEKWHYSGIKYLTKAEGSNTAVLTESNCLKQLYADRVIAHKATIFLQIPIVQKQVMASLGGYAKQWWKEL